VDEARRQQRSKRRQVAPCDRRGNPPRCFQHFVTCVRGQGLTCFDRPWISCQRRPVKPDMFQTKPCRASPGAQRFQRIDPRAGRPA
jgi:hypothetical protein